MGTKTRSVTCLILPSCLKLKKDPPSWGRKLLSRGQLASRYALLKKDPHHGDENLLALISLMIFSLLKKDPHHGDENTPTYIDGTSISCWLKKDPQSWGRKLNSRIDDSKFLDSVLKKIPNHGDENPTYIEGISTSCWANKKKIPNHGDENDEWVPITLDASHKKNPQPWGRKLATRVSTGRCSLY